jgi:hypothetical protein
LNNLILHETGENVNSAGGGMKKGQKIFAIYNLPQNPPLGDGDFVCFFGKSTIDNLPL